MKEYEIRVSASYISAGTKYWNAFKVYTLAPSADAAKEETRLRLEEEGYLDIEMDEPTETN